MPLDVIWMDFYLRLRLIEARQLDEYSWLPLSEVAQATGFNSQSYFSKRFRETCGLMPSDARKECRSA